MAKKELHKSEDKMLCGVCAGIAEYMDSDVTLVRLLGAVIVIFTFPIGLLLYLLACVIMPEE